MINLNISLIVVIVVVLARLLVELISYVMHTYIASIITLTGSITISVIAVVLLEQYVL